MTDCPNCEYHRNRAARWRAEAYAQAGHDIIERTWVGLTDEETRQAFQEKCSEFNHWFDERAFIVAANWAEAKLKEKNSA